MTESKIAAVSADQPTRRLGAALVLAAAFGLAGGAIGLTGCETIKGVGEDVTNAGEALDDAVTGDDG